MRGIHLSERISGNPGSKHYTRKESANRCRALAFALHKRSIGIGNRKGSAVAVLRFAAAVFDCRSSVLAVFIPTRNIR